MENKKQKIIGIGLLFLEVALLFSLFSLMPTNVIAAIGNPANVTTWLEIGNVYPDILNVSINGMGSTPIILIPNSTKLVSCVAVIRDYNGDSDIAMVNATFYDSTSSSVGADDNNDHYSNSTCKILPVVVAPYTAIHADDLYHSLANCTFEVEYYANYDPSWVCNVTVEDNMTWSDTKWNIEEVSELLSVGLPDIINYTKVNATEISPEQIANVTNYGNVEINLTLESYGVSSGDGWAMNCSLGNVGTIDAMYEKYNLTASTPGVIASLTDFELTYINITATGVPVTKQFNLLQRTDDLPGGEIIKPTYWRIYVPKGVAGTCTGIVQFGATTAAE